MNRLEKLSQIFLFAGLGLFILSFLSLAVYPVWMVEKLSPEEGLPLEVPKIWKATYSTVDDYHRALEKGRDIYIAEACWHCHSQFVRPTANESLRYGPVSMASEHQNRLNLPQLFGTRRVGPDLSREAGKKSNEWHYAHLFKPTDVVPQSVMPQYPWFFDVRDGVPVPNEKARALVAYLQWLGSGVQNRRESPYDYEQEVYPPAE